MRRTALREGLRGALLLCVAAALLVWPRESAQAAREGLALCGQTVVPSLFPFFVLSGMVMKLDVARHLGRGLEPVMWPLFRVGGAGAAALLLGLVGGYPVGARTAVELYREGACSKGETERLLAFCNNSGPAFILGVVGAGVFGSARAGLVLYATHVAAALCVGVLFRFYAAAERGGGKRPACAAPPMRLSAAFVDSVHAAVSAVLNVCGFVVSFAVVIRLLERSGVPAALAWAGPEAGPLLRGMLEVTSGVVGLTGEGRMAVAAFLLGWAGVCVHCQTLCFLSGSGLGVGTYLTGKALHGTLSALFILVIDRLFPRFLPTGGWSVRPMERGLELGFVGTSVLLAATVWLVFWAAVRNAKKRGGKRERIAV